MRRQKTLTTHRSKGKKRFEQFSIVIFTKEANFQTENACCHLVLADGIRGAGEALVVLCRRKSTCAIKCAH